LVFDDKLPGVFGFISQLHEVAIVLVDDVVMSAIYWWRDLAHRLERVPHSMLLISDKLRKNQFECRHADRVTEYV
jgi:hypothetical protein